jgi:hydroxymethylpyrimidine/phosphomethylpyrimidine kinase
LAHGEEPLQAARAARAIAGAAVRDGLRSVGAGSGPVDALGIAANAPSAAASASFAAASAPSAAANAPSPAAKPAGGAGLFEIK